MIASVRWAPASHWEGSPALMRESEPSTRILVAGFWFAPTDCWGARVEIAEKGSSIVSIFEPSEWRSHRPRAPTPSTRTRTTARTETSPILHARLRRRGAATFPSSAEAAGAAGSSGVGAETALGLGVLSLMGL